jgi:hypothetical protein
MPPFTFTNLIGAVRQAAELVQRAWIAAAQGASLSPGQQAAYTAGLLQAQSLQHPFAGDPLQALVSNVAPEAQRIEAGTPAYHLPSVINWAQSPAARRSATGVYYIFVPFRHRAPRTASHGTIAGAVKRQMLSEAVYRRARRLRPGQSLTAGPSRGARVHAPGLTPYVPAFPRNIRPGYEHAAREERLRRYPGRGRGRGGGASYFTFRTLTSDSSGWWIPGKPGRPISATVQQETAGEVRALLDAAARQDVEDALHETLGDQGGGA